LALISTIYIKTKTYFKQNSGKTSSKGDPQVQLSPNVDSSLVLAQKASCRNEITAGRSCEMTPFNPKFY